MNRTTIEWVKNPDGSQGYTWNPITGCLNSCPYCYARKLANGRLRSRYLANEYTAPQDFSAGGGGFDGELTASFNPFYPRFWEDRIQELAKRNDLKPRGIFVCDMGELFGDWIPTNWQWSVFEVIKHNPQHHFYLLTKQPQNLVKWSPFPENCWVGISVTNNKQMNEALYFNPDYKAKIKFLSFEPLLERIDKSRLAIYRYDWLIIGAQTKPYKPPKLGWVKRIVEAADKVGIPVFLKDNLTPLLEDEPFYKCEADGDWRIRQEMPR